MDGGKVPWLKAIGQEGARRAVALKQEALVVAVKMLQSAENERLKK